MNMKYFISGCICLLIIFVAILYYLFKTDNIVYFAYQQYPLDEIHSYILRKNDESKEIPSGVTYLIAHENEKDTHFDFGTSGRVVGKTDVDLEKYVNKKIIIEGYHYDGKPLMISTKGVPSYYYEESMAVIYVKNISIANEK